MRLFPRNSAIHPKAHHPPYKSSTLRAPSHRPLQLPSTPTEETGPVFGHDILGPLDADLTRNFGATDAVALGPQIIVHGRVQDETGRPVPNALIEIWQANAAGRYRHRNDEYTAPLDPNFGGCGRTITDPGGVYSFRTIKPSPYPWPNGPNSWRPAHIHFSLFGSAFGQRLITQMYFEGDPLIPLCPIVSAISDERAVDQLTAPLDLDATQPMDALAYRFDIVLRGRTQIQFENRRDGL
ncbi:MAG: protocatechuate 3,4-dioxygenase subunit beta [Paracoccaceae bacterium]